MTAVDPSPDTARDQLVGELQRQEYREPLGERAWRWVVELLGRLGDAASGTGTLGVVVAVVLVLVLVVLVGVALSRLRRDGGREVSSSAAVFTAQRRTAAEHRQAAREALGQDRHDDAVLESVRALTAGLVERELLVDTVGLTALEATRAAAARFADLGDRLDTLGRTFDDIRYGERPADRDAAEAAVGVEQAVADAAPSAAPGRVAGMPVPS